MTGPEGPRKPRVFSPDDPDVRVTEAHFDAGQFGGTDDQRADSRAKEGPERGGAEEDSGASAKTAAGPRDSAAQTGGPMPEQVVSKLSRRFGWGSVFVWAFFSLATLAAGLWYTRFISVALARDDWLGLLANGVAILLAVALFVLFLRELIGLWRLSKLTAIRRDAEAALRQGDLKDARSVVARVKRLARRSRDKRWDLDRFREEERHKRTSRELLGLADRVLLERADKQAKTVIYESARRVAVVTAIVPVAFVVVLFVLFENLRMLRRLAGAYGGRPGFFGGLRLFWWIVTHLAATGAIALTDDLWGQFLGQDVARRVSRKLGEGAFNGALTARLGVAAIGLTRPLPFIEASQPRMRSILAELFPEFDAASLMKGAFGGQKSEDAKGDRR